MYLGDRLGHLAYATLVHPSDTWAEMRASLERYAPEVKARVSPNAPFGISLRLSAASAAELHADAGERMRLRDWLNAHEMYIFTVNAFPYGSFKGDAVMDRVYEPDWSTRERLEYTCRVADVLVDIAPDSVAPSIQTAPLAFRPKVRSEADVDALTHNVLRAVAHLVKLEATTGRRVKLALEPEPFCYLATTAETIRYFQNRIWSGAALRSLSELTGLPTSETSSAVRRHLGVVFDIGHQSVEFEDVAESLRLLRDSGVPIFKLQAAAALRVPRVDATSVAALERFTNTIYLSQTTESRDGSLTRMLTLREAIDSWHGDPTGEREWRTHFHVPVFLGDLGPFGTTRFGIEAALREHALLPLSDHLEIETYTWDVLPDDLKDGDITDYLTRELNWLIDALRSEQRSRHPA